MYPSSVDDLRSDRANVEAELSSFFAGTQARAFRELSLAGNASLYILMNRPVDIVIRQFNLLVNAGSIRLEIYRSVTPAGSFSEVIPINLKNAMPTRPLPYYVPQVTLSAGGTFSGGSLYDVILVKTASATAQQATIGVSSNDQLGVPGGSVGGYKFTNMDNATSTGIFSLWWEELPPAL